MKKGRAAMLYGLLKQSRSTRMEDAGKIKVLRIMKSLRPTASEYDADVNEAREKMKDEDFDRMTQLAEKWQMKGGKAVSQEERASVNIYFTKYNQQVEKAVAAIFDKEKEITLEKLTEEEFKALISSNDYTGEQMELLDDTIVGGPEKVAVFGNKT